MLLSLAVGAAVTAYTVSGAKARNLWIVSGAFFAMAVGWFLFSARIPFTATQAVPLIIALVPIVTVSFVAMMLRDRAQTAPERPKERREERADKAPDRLAALISNALYDAADARVQRNNRAAELALPIVQATMITLNKEAGVPLPQNHGDVRLDLEIGSRLLEKVKPFIKQGHNAQAREAAEAWILQTTGMKEFPSDTKGDGGR